MRQRSHRRGCLRLSNGKLGVGNDLESLDGRKRLQGAETFDTQRQSRLGGQFTRAEMTRAAHSRYYTGNNRIDKDRLMW